MGILTAMVPISVVICCANVADTLEAACRSVAEWADELVIVDSGSTDATPEIAQRHADRYVVEPWRGYTKQKQYGASLAKNPWVLVLDGDEEVSAELAAEIGALTAEELDRYDVLSMPRRNYVMGRWIRCYGPDWQSRLIQRDRTVWADEVLHDNRLPGDPSRGRRLRGWLLHMRTSGGGFTDYFSGRQYDERLLMVARQMHRRGKRCRWWSLWTHPFAAFFRCYITRRGILEGQVGLLAAQKKAVEAQLKYAALWAIQHGVEPLSPGGARDGG